MRERRSDAGTLITVRRRRTAAAAALSVACALLALLPATTSSPLYATNFWTDTNVYFTVGRGMLHGLMPYRDLFDHKGPLLYLLYALGALVSDTSYAGVFLLQAASLACALFLGWRTVCLYGEGALTLAAIPIEAAVTATCAAYTQGGSAEEFCLPALALALLCALLRMREGTACRRRKRLYALFGAAMGWVFSIKYTDCGLFFGLGLMAALWEGRVCGFARAVTAALHMAAGFALVLVPQAVFLAAAGVLDDCVRVYFIQNIFEYGGDPMSMTSHLYNALAYLRTQSLANPVVAALAAFGLAWAFGEAVRRGGRGCGFEAMAAPFGAGLLLLFAYWGSLCHPYYALVFAALTPLGLAPLGALAGHVRARTGGWITLACAVAVLPACGALCRVVPLMSVRREDMAQTRFAEIMNAEEHPTLLDRTGLDQGFYLAAGIVPTCRYFADNNLNTEEKLTAIAGYVERREPQFIVTSFRTLDSDGYALVAEMQDCPFDMLDPRPYRLYKRIEEADDGRAD